MSTNNKKINLLIYIAGLHHGGAERVVSSLCNNLDKSKFCVTVCWRTSRSAIGDELLALGYDVIGLPELDPAVTPYRRFLVLKKLLRDKRIDVVHTHDTGSLADTAQCRILGSNIHLVHTFHYGNYANLKRNHLIIEIIFSRFANKLVAVGYEQAKSICKKLHLFRTKLDIVYNGVEIPKTDTQQNLTEPYRNKPGNPVIIGSISTLTEQKGITYLLDSVAILKSRGVKCVFLIAGDGPLRFELEEKCRKLDITDTVYFLGWVDNAANKLLPSLDIFCQPSLWEANSIVLLEAMANGLPIVTTDVGESRHVIDDGHSGRIVISTDTSGLADALNDLVDNPELRRQMGENALNKFSNNYTVDKMIEHYERIYESLCKAKN